MLYDIYPTINYNTYLLKNFCIDLPNIYKEVLNKFITQKYTIKGFPRPDILAAQLYGNPEYEWIFLLLNNITDPFHQWIKTEDQVYETVQLLYQDGPDGIHHYIDPEDDDRVYYDITEFPIGSGQWYNVGDTTHQRVQVQGNLIPITNYEYEISQNELKRDILIINPSQVSKFIDEVERQINERYNKKY